MMVAIGAVSLLNFAIIRCGASTTSIIAMLEPLTGVLFGYLLLQEQITLMNALGFVLIAAGVILVSRFSKESA
jgi:drug/metabolite transporter (DMT)-like permease